MVNKVQPIDPTKEYPLMKLVQMGLFPNMTNYATVLKNLIETDIVKHKVMKRFDDEGNERVAARRYYVYGWSLLEYLDRYKTKKSQVIEIRKGGE